LDGLKPKDLRLVDSKLFVNEVTNFLGKELSLSWQQLHAMAEQTKNFLQDLSKANVDAIKDARRLIPGFLLSNLKKLVNDVLVKGLGELSECFEDVQETFSQVELLNQKVLGAVSTSEFPEKVADWSYSTLNKLGCLTRGFSCGELVNLTSTAVKASSLVHNNAEWSPTQLNDLVHKFADQKRLSGLGSLVNGINPDDIDGLPEDALDFGSFNSGGYNKMSRSQLLALFQRRKELKQDLSDESQWGWDAIKEMGRALVSLSPSDISQLPEESFEDIISYGLQFRGWTEGQAKAVWMTVKKRYKITSPSQFAKATVRDVAVFGRFVAQVETEYLDYLSVAACKQVVLQLGETEDLSSVASRQQLSDLSHWALRCLRKEEPSLQRLTSDHLSLLGRLVVSLDENALDMITKEALSESLEFIGYLAKDATLTELQRLANLVKKHWSVRDLSAEQIVNLGSILQGFSPSDLEQMNEGNVVAALDEIGSKLRLAAPLAEAVIAKVKAVWGSNVSRWDADNLLRLGKLLSSLSKDDLESISSDVIDDVVDYLGELDDLESNSDKLAAILSVIKKAWGPLTSFTASQFRRLGRLGVGISAQDWTMIFKTASLSCSDTAHALGQAVSWSSAQLGALKPLIKTTVAQWTTEFPFTKLGNLSAAVNASDLTRLPPKTAKRAAGILGKVVGFARDQKTAVVNKLKESEAWGSVSMWTRAQISNAGNLLSGFSRDDIRTLQPEQLGGIDEPTIQQLGSDFFSAMENSQLESLEPQQARLVLGAYSSALTVEQVDALERSAGTTGSQSGLSTDSPQTQASRGTSLGISLLAGVGLVMVAGLMNHF
jgi:hypothetical protein